MNWKGIGLHFLSAALGALLIVAAIEVWSLYQEFGQLQHEVHAIEAYLSHQQ